jgi:hypothetical protein
VAAAGDRDDRPEAPQGPHPRTLARTGERYTTARRHLVGTVAPPADDGGYRLRGGVHPDTAALANVLTHGGAALSEALVLGVGGGLGAGYILWEFKAHGNARVLVLGFRNQWQYPDRFSAKVIERLGVAAEVHETSGARGAAARLDTSLAEGRPAIVMVDAQLLGTWHQPAFLEGHAGYPVVAVRQEGDRVHLDDRNLEPLTVARAALDAARTRIGSYRHRLVVPRPDGPVPEDRLRAAVEAGLADQVAHLRAASDSFSLPAWRKWGRLMTDTRNAKAWPRVFADSAGLVEALVSLYEGVEPIGVDGGNLRTLYAAFLEEAADLLGRPALRAAAEPFCEAADRWHDLAEAVLPADQPDLATIRDELAALHAAVIGEGDAGEESARAAAARLWELRGRYRRDSPMEADATAALFVDLGARLAELHRTETAAIDGLARALA